jgi:outer membrane lipoprotein-sorting protein
MELCLISTAKVLAHSAANENPIASPLAVNQVVERMTRMNFERSEALRSYTSVRVYHLELKGIIHESADMVARMTYHWPDQKEFTIITESGSEIMRNRVLKAILAAEKEAMQKENRERTALNMNNYDLSLAGVEGEPQPKYYILEAKPKVKNKFLFKGKVWVDARDFAVTRIEGEPAKNPSWWTKKNDITYTYQKLGDFWLPAHTESITDVRVFGHTVLSIEYKDYHLIETRELQTALEDEQRPQQKVTSGTSPSR